MSAVEGADRWCMSDFCPDQSRGAHNHIEGQTVYRAVEGADTTAVEALDRFYTRVAMGPNGCHIWTGTRATNGYGQFHAHSKRWASHRWIYTRLVGPIPDGLVIDHVVCDTPLCVNPAHLEPKTQAENILRGRGPTAINAAKTECINGHPLSGDNLFIAAQGRRKCRQCKRERERASQSRYIERKRRTNNAWYALNKDRVQRQRKERESRG